MQDRSFTALRILAWSAASLVIVHPVSASAETTNETCLECHADSDNVGVRYHVKARFAGGPHTEARKVSCVSCHVKAGAVADVSDHGKLGKPSCAPCHAAIQRGVAGGELGRGVHASDASRCRICHGPAHAITSRAHRGSPVHPRRQPETCGRCHRGAVVRNYLRSVHGRRLLGGKADGPTCSSCHGAHDVGLADIDRNPAFKLQVTRVCAGCHRRVAAAYGPSVHGVALLKKRIFASASCVDCHRSHDILPHTEPGSSVHPTRVVHDCESCHADARLIRRLQLPEDVVSTYAQSYHGQANRLGDPSVANCSSCHEHHGIYRAADPRSSVHRDNLARSCGRCHPGAAGFVVDRVHTRNTRERNYWAWLVEQIYTWLIVIVIGGMLLHNLLDLLRKLVLRARAQRAAPHHLHMPLHDRVMHGLLLLSFVVLAYTGFALRYPGAWWAAPLNWISASEAFRSITHRLAGVVMIVLSIEHLLFIGFTRRGRRKLGQLWPRWRDLGDLWHGLRFYLGRRRARPRFGRYPYAQKVEYWAVAWGTVVMIVSGLVMWFEEWSLGLMPLWLWEVFHVVHRFEAILSVLAVMVWHLYHVLVNPDAAPMSLTWVTGRITEEEAARLHPEAYPGTGGATAEEVSGGGVAAEDITS